MADRLAVAPPDPMAAVLARAAREPIDVDELADRLGLSTRQLHRRSVAAFGYGPKTLQRILRFSRAVSLARSAATFAEVAADGGYADQAHLAREVKDLSGLMLRELLAGG